MKVARVLIAKQGLPGPASTVPGPSAYDIAVQNGFVGTEAEWLEGLAGPPGQDSQVPGPSAYDVAVANGFSGTENEWLTSLRGSGGGITAEEREQLDQVSSVASEVGGLENRLQTLSMANLIAADGVPVRDLLPVTEIGATVFIDSADVPAGAVSELAAKGQNGPTLSQVGSGVDVVSTDDGIVFSAGTFLRGPLPEPVTIKRAVIVLDLTPTANVSGTVMPIGLAMAPDTKMTVQVSQTNDGQVMRLYGPGGARLDAGLVKLLDKRFVIAFEVDLESGLISLSDEDGYTSHAIIENNPDSIDVREVRIGQGCQMALHRAAVFMEPV